MIRASTGTRERPDQRVPVIDHDGTPYLSVSDYLSATGGGKYSFYTARARYDEDRGAWVVLRPKRPRGRPRKERPA